MVVVLPRPPKPHRIGVATSKARGATFNQLTRSAKTGVAVENVRTYWPFTGPEAAENKRKYRDYATDSQGAIQRALDIEVIAAHVDRATGTAPELVLLGFYLERGFHMNTDLYFQTATFRDPIFNPTGHAFPVDVMVVSGGVMVYMPVDGAHYHQATLVEEARDATRNGQLSRYGRVVPVSDVYCHTLTDLKAYLHGMGAP